MNPDYWLASFCCKSWCFAVTAAVPTDPDALATTCHWVRASFSAVSSRAIAAPHAPGGAQSVPAASAARAVQTVFRRKPHPSKHRALRPKADSTGAVMGNPPDYRRSSARLRVSTERIACGSSGLQIGNLAPHLSAFRF
jgi:hypothetical protein